MIDFLNNLGFWHWLILGVLLVIVETMAPGAYFLWLGISATIIGALLWLFPGMGWEIQVLLFAILGIVSILAWRAYLKKHPTVSDAPTLNRRGEQYVGRIFSLEMPIVNGIGKIRVDDSTWKVQGEDLPAGKRVRVTGVNGTVLLVEVEPSTNSN